MSDHLTHSAEGVARLHVEIMTGDAVVRGLPEASVIEAWVVGKHDFELDGDVLRLEGRAERIVVPAGLPVTIEEANGNLRLQALTGPVEINEVRGDLRVDRTQGPVVVGDVDGDVRCDAAAQVIIKHGCSGDVRFAGGGALSSADIGGDVRVSDAGSLEVGDLSGDLWAERLSGPLAVRDAGGDARLSDVAGPVTIERLSGDFRGAGLVGGLMAPAVHGDALIHGPFAGESYAVTADGDVSLHLSAVDDVRLTVRAAGRIRADLPLTPTADGTPTYTATTGAGAVRVTANAGGDLRVARAGGPQAGAAWERKRGPERDPLADLSGLGERIRQQVAASLASAGINIETGDIDAASAKHWRGSRWGRGAPPQPPTPSSPPRPQAGGKPPPKPGANSEETMTILRLVEEGKITPEEADKLLRALGA